MSDTMQLGVKAALCVRPEEHYFYNVPRQLVNCRSSMLDMVAEH